MSIIGSAWGQETVSNTVEITPDNVTTVSKNNYSYTTENLSVALYVEINTDKKNPNGDTYDNFKFNNEKTCTITVPENATISKVEFYGISDNKGNIALKDGTALTKRDDLSDEENSLFYYITTYDNTQSGAKTLVFNRDGSTNCHIQKIKVTYTYTPVSATGISLSQTTAVLAVGGELTLNATVSPDNATDKSVTWSSNNTGVATVDANGNVTAMAAGTAGITATSNSDGNVTATCTVVVPAVLSVGATQKTATVANITSFNKCVITKSGQLMDCAQNGSYVIFQVTPEVSGTYSFTSKIATPQDGETVELFCGETSLGVKNITPSGSANDWDTGEKYTWTCTLEQGQTYDIKVVCAHDGEDFYTANIFDMNIVKMVYPWTVSGNTLTIEPNKVEGNIGGDGNPKGLLVSGGMSTADDSMDDIPGLNVTLTGDALNRWEIWGTAYGKKNPTKFNGNIPQDGTYIVLEPTQSGTVTIKTRTYDNHTYTLVDANGNVIKSETPGDNSNGYVFNATLNAGTKYYYYISGNKYNLGFSSITYELVKYTTYVKVADFNYDRGPTGLANNNRDIDRTVGGFVFDFDKPNYQGIKINDVTKLDFQTTDSGSGMLNISLDNNNQDNVISKIVITGADLNNCSVENGTIALSDDNKSATITVTDGTQPVVIQGGGFSVTQFDITTDFKPVFEKIKPVITLGAESIDVVINEHNATNALKTWNDKSTLDGSLSVDQSFFALTYKITENGTGSTVYNDYGNKYEESDKEYRYLQGTVKAGTVMGSETVTVSFAGNDYYEPVSVTFEVNVIDNVSFEHSEVVFAVNTSKAYTAATGDDGKVTYTALEGNVNTVTSTAGNAMTYTSSDENLIKVNAETGELSLGDNWTAGKTVTITATSAAGQTATYTVKLKFETSIEFSVESVYAHLNVGFVEPKATIVPAGVNLVTYSSNNLKIATVNESTGEVTFPASSTGTVAITATIPDNDYYMGSSDTYEITVGSAISAGDAALTEYQIVSYKDSKYTANTGHKFTVENATTAGQIIISGEQFTNVPGIELTFGAYTGDGNVNDGVPANLGTTWTLGEDKYLAHQTAATYDKETNLPTGGYIAFEPVVSGILTMDLTWYKGQTFVLVDKSTNAIVESYTAGSEYAGEHRFSTPLQAGRTYYLYNKGGKVDGEEVNGVMKFRSASFTPVFLDKVTSIIPSKLTDGKVLFEIKGADYYNGSSVIPSLSTAKHAHDDITYTLSDGTYLNMTADGVFEILEAMEGNNNAVTVTITANIEAKTAAPNDDTDGDSDHMHSSVAVCQVTYTKSDIKFAKESIDVTLFADNVGADITEPGINYLKDDITYSSDNANAFSVDSNTGNLSVGTNPSGKTTITATVNNEDITRYYTSSSASYVVNCSNYGHVNLVNTEITMTVGQTGYNILKEECIKIFNNDADKLKECFRLNENGTFYGDAGKRDTYYKLISDEFIGKGNDGGVTRFYKDATKTVADKKNGAENTNIVYVSKAFSVDAKTVGTTTVYVNLEKIALSNNGNAEDAIVETQYDAVTIPIKVTVVPREFNAEDATLRVWDFTKEIDAETLQAFATENSGYWTYNEKDNIVHTSVIKPTEEEDAAYYNEYHDEENGFKREDFLLAKKAFENKEFSLPVFSETMASEGSKDILKLSTFNLSNYEFYSSESSGGRYHNHELNIVTDINLNQKTTIKDNNYMTPVSGSDTNLGESSEVNYRGIRLMGKASFLHVPNVDDNISIVMIADHVTNSDNDYLNFASSGSKQAGIMVGPNGMKDGSYAVGYNYNRLTNVINYAPQKDIDGNLVAEVAVEPQGGQVDIVSVIAGYIATSGILNKGEGKVPTSADTRTDGYTTVVSPYNIDMTGQKVVKAYICDYYGKVNNKVHMKQIKHIPANTPVMLRGYARDLYALFISEGNKAVDPGVDESFIKNNRLRGNATEDIYVPLEETEVNSEGEVVKYYNYGLSGSKWVKFGVDGTMKAGKAYLRLTEEEWADLQEAMISSAGVSATRLSFEFEDLDASDDNVSTGIVQVGTQKDVAGDGYYYSINGVRMGKEKPASKGVYIYNGRKIVIK